MEVNTIHSANNDLRNVIGTASGHVVANMKFFKNYILKSSISKSPMCKLNLQKKWPHETPFTKEAHTFTLGLSLNGSSFGI